MKKLQYEPFEDMRVRFKRNEEMDPDADIRGWDFLVLHKASSTCDEYDASRYMHTRDEWKLNFVAPMVPGTYHISAVRDIAYCFKVLEAQYATHFKKDTSGVIKLRMERMRNLVRADLKEHFVVLANLCIEVRNVVEEDSDYGNSSSSTIDSLDLSGPLATSPNVTTTQEQYRVQLEIKRAKEMKALVMKIRSEMATSGSGGESISRSDMRSETS